MNGINILSLENIHENAKSEIAAYGSKQAAIDHRDRAKRAEALLPNHLKYVEPYGEPLARKAIEIWNDYGKLA